VAAPALAQDPAASFVARDASGDGTTFNRWDAGAGSTTVTIPAGTINVVGSAAPPAGPSQPPPPPPPSPAASIAPAGGAVTVSAIQRGNVVRGSLNVARAGSRLDVRGLVARRKLTTTRRTGSTSVAAFRRTSVGGRRVAFTLSLSATARRALKRAGRISVTVQISVKPRAGAAFTAKRAVSLRAPK
jgi:hypothetical protein